MIRKRNGSSRKGIKLRSARVIDLRQTPETLRIAVWFFVLMHYSKQDVEAMVLKSSEGRRADANEILGKIEQNDSALSRSLTTRSVNQDAVVSLVCEVIESFEGNIPATRMRTTSHIPSLQPFVKEAVLQR